jgi:hypothetical protein
MGSDACPYCLNTLIAVVLRDRERFGDIKGIIRSLRSKKDTL